MDELGEQFGAKPNLTKLFFSDPVLWYHVYFGPLLPYHYRINGPHAWSGARKAIMTVDELLWYHVYFGPLLPYHYRINGPHAWSGARKAIMTVDERIQAPLQTRKLINVSTKSNDNLGMASFIIPIFAILICLIKFWFP
ncbi:dimethylaniline monooxygenase [N-oxide-forming] 2-like [Tetranychus urticae]|uniref:dimethylaniline monooxygenase [N-oxide-forming] 2-like n=1 Tax=Tetranychus urticae TaxID=32264 RepID=UPI000D64EF47|nr:dimethylaniline monooxygenase [N-oxide-forming] 2-like [Tetranychus urticae]